MKTRQFLLLSLIFLVSVTSTMDAQTHRRRDFYGDIYGGMTLASMDRPLSMSGSSGEKDYNETKLRMGMMVGGTVNVKVYKFMLLQTGFQMLKKGSIKHENRIVDRDGIYERKDIKQSVDANYMQIPLSIGAELPISKDWSVNAAVGVFGAYGFKGEIKQRGYTAMIINGVYQDQVAQNQGPHKIFNSSRFNKWDYGVTGNISLIYDIFLLRLQYDHGLADVATEAFNSTRKTKHWRSRNFAICLGFRL